MRDHTQIINSYIKKVKARTYVEIGVSIPKNNFDLIKCQRKIGVDPEPKAKATFVMTSDEYFKNEARISDVYFLDGDHTAEQIERDIINASKHLTKGGIILCHDANPTEKIQTLLPRQNKQFTGDVFRTFVGFRKKYPDVETYTYPQDWGIFCIVPKGQVFEKGFVSNITFNDFMKNKEILLNFV